MKPWRGIQIGTVVTGMVFALSGNPGLDSVKAEEPGPGTSQGMENRSTLRNSLENLKHLETVTIETNAPSSEARVKSSAKEKAFDWKASWRGWQGLDLQLSHRTWLGQFMPGATNVEQAGWALPGPAAFGTNAYRLHLEKAQMTANLGAKLAVDGAAYLTGHGYPGIDPGIELRRARVFVRGDCILVMPVSYELEVGYVPNQFYIENSFLALRDLPWVGELKGGQFQAPMGLDVVTSSRDISLMESSAATEALAPGVNAGIQLGRPVFQDRATWKLGFFTDGVGTDFGDATKDYGRIITRLTGLPIFLPKGQEEATKLLHLGLSANILYTASAVRYRSRPESHLAPYVIDTGNISADGALVTGGEIAWVNGPLTLQGEYLKSWVHENAGRVPSFGGLYGSASWFLTGETRPYDRQNGYFGRPIPRHDFNWGKGGWGAWEIAARFSFVDLNSENVNGGRLSEIMAGLNWYLHSHVKWRFDYGLAHVAAHQPDGNIHIFQTRIEMDF